MFLFVIFSEFESKVSIPNQLIANATDIHDTDTFVGGKFVTKLSNKNMQASAVEKTIISPKF